MDLYGALGLAWVSNYFVFLDGPTCIYSTIRGHNVYLHWWMEYQTGSLCLPGLVLELPLLIHSHPSFGVRQ